MVAAIAAAGLPVAAAAAVVHGSRVVACSAAARAAGVRRGMRKREAQSICPELTMFAHDPDRDGRMFEPVAAAVETVAAGLEIVRPGLIALPVAGPARHAGSEAALAEQLVDQVAALAGVESQVGICEGVFAAGLAAKLGRIVEPGGAREFLAPVPLTELSQPGADRSDLVGRLHRLGLHTLGDFAALAERDVVGRFDRDVVVAHRLARGLSERPPSRRTPPKDLTVRQTFEDDPLDRIDSVAFAARTLGSRLHVRLADGGLAVTQLAIHAVTESGEEHSRTWRAAEPLSASGITDRVRWQCEGWLRRREEHRPSSGIVRLTLEPAETVSGGALQLSLPAAGAVPDADDRAARAVGRVQGLLGPDAVFTAVLGGGRGPAEQVRLVPWGDLPDDDGDGDAPWPGRLPAPSPATVPPEPWPAQVLGPSGAAVAWTARHRLTEHPDAVVVGTGPPRQVLSWAGPWPAVVTRIGPGGSRRVVRIQAVLARQRADDDGDAVLLTGNIGRDGVSWTVEGIYD
ncbi:protein ImuB [Amycolatopsis rubida]|uniref:Protein ImuB n=1 Tax=Amycolatopsis rubida TaxID=112413 RepID=A0A1I5X9F6_9PSEU|nr:protein ImuB [Amycolatopsis rubida]